MPATPQKGTTPESDKTKQDLAPQGEPRVVKGGVVPTSRASSPAEASPNQATTPSSAPAQAAQAQSPSPSQATSTSPAPQDQYAGWPVLGLEIDTKDPLIQRELRVHPTSGEVVRVPVGKAAAAGESPTPATVSPLHEAGFGQPSPTPGSAGATRAEAPTTPTSTTPQPHPPK